MNVQYCSTTIALLIYTTLYRYMRRVVRQKHKFEQQSFFQGFSFLGI